MEVPLHHLESTYPKLISEPMQSLALIEGLADT